MSQAADQLLQTLRPAAHIRPASWFFRRALLGLLALSVFTIGSAWLMYASIDADEAALQSPTELPSE